MARWRLALKTGAVVVHGQLHTAHRDDHVQLPVTSERGKRQSSRSFTVATWQNDDDIKVRNFWMIDLGFDDLNVSLQVDTKKMTDAAIVPDILIGLKRARVAV